MQLTVQGKQIDVGDALRVHATEKIEDLSQKYFNHTTDATVTFSREGHGHGLHKALISIRIGKNIQVLGEAVEGDPYFAFDTAAARVAKQLRRYKRRLRDHHARTNDTPESEIIKARDYTIATTPQAAHEEEEPAHGADPLIVAEMTMNIETLSVSEAVMRMDLAGQTALLFRNASHNELNMVYRREDGNVGWVDPVQAAAVKNARRA